MKQTMHTMEAQPATLLPMAAHTMAQMTPIKLIRLTKMPDPVIRRMGSVSYTHLDVYKRQLFNSKEQFL